MIVDAHMHIWNRLHGKIGGTMPLVGLGSGRVRVGEAEVLGMPASFTDSLALAERFIGEMDAAGVEVGVVVQENMDGEQNDYCLQTQQRYPGRFFCHGLPDYFQPGTFESQCQRLFEQGFQGLKVPGGHLVTAGVKIDEPAFMGVWKHMAERGFIVAIDFSEGPDQVPELRRVLEKHPQLKVAIGHFGMPNRGGWPAQLELCRFENVYVEMGGIVWLYRHEGIAFPTAIDAIRQARDSVGIDKLMWASDWPRTMVDFTYRQSLDFLRHSPAFTQAEKAAMLGDNAARLYQLDVPAMTRQPLPRITEG